MRHKPIIILFLLALATSLMVSNITFAQEKQKDYLAPIGALGEFSEMEKQIIFNSLQESLSTRYVLASKKSFEAAQTQSFEELEYDECTEEQCFAMIQQILKAIEH